jgi:putative transposase
MFLGRQEDRRPRKHHKPEEIVAKLRQVDVLTSQGKSVADVIRAIGVTGWRTIAGVRSTAVRSDQVKRMKDLEAENTRLRRAVSDLTLDKMILADTITAPTARHTNSSHGGERVAQIGSQWTGETGEG